MQLKQILTAKGLKQDDIAAMTGLSKSFVSQLVSGSRQPSTETLDLLATALQVTPAQLLDTTGFQEPAAGSPFIRRTLESLDQPPPLADHDFRVGTDGKMVQIMATVDRNGIDRLIQKLEAMKLLLDP